MKEDTCEHKNKELIPAFKGSWDEPARIECWYCPDCDETFDVDDEATQRGI